MTSAPNLQEGCGLVLPDYRFAAYIPLFTASNRTFPHTCRLGMPQSTGGHWHLLAPAWVSH